MYKFLTVSLGWEWVAMNTNAADCSFRVHGLDYPITWIDDDTRADGRVVNALSNGVYGLYVPEVSAEGRVSK